MIKKLVLLSGILFTLASCNSTKISMEENPQSLLLSKETCAGKWHASASVGSGYSDRYALNNDGTYIYHASDMDGENRLRYTAGSWDIQDGNLLLNVEKKIILEGGEPVAAYASYATPTVIEGGVYVFTQLEKPEAMVIPLGIVSDEETGETPDTIIIGGETYWRWTQNNDDMFLSFETLQQRLIESQYRYAYILPDSHKIDVEEEILNHFDIFTLSLAKNEIFARHGYVFKNEALAAYFNNMPWYQPNGNFSGAYEDLSAIEQKNFDLIQKKYDTYYDGIPTALPPNIKTENGLNIIEVKKDLDGDGHQEIIRMEINIPDETSPYDNIISLSIESMGIRHELDTSWALNPVMNIYLAKFDVEDPIIRFYTEDYGPSNDLTTIVYSFENGNIHSQELIGHISRYDGSGKIYTEYNRFLDQDYTFHSYYDLDTGLVPDTQSAIGKKMIFPMDVMLWDGPTRGYTFIQPYIVGDSYIEYMQQLYPQETQDHLVAIVEKNTPLEIVDVVFEMTDTSYDTEPWVQLKTSGGQTGWARLVRGD